MQKRYFIQLAFNGKNYHGWQFQQNATTVQQTLNNSLDLILGQTVGIVGCGRTDAGVHARLFVAHFDSGAEIDGKLLTEKLNSFLPKDIVIDKILLVKPGAHARFDATSRTYRYYISTVKNPFLLDFSYYFRGDLDVGLMNSGASMLKEVLDFTSFSKVRTQVKTNLCSITEAKWEKDNDLLVFTITADRFLRNMVRAIVGTLLMLGRNKLNLIEFREVIEGRNRSLAGESVPACGLFLEDVVYPDHIYLQFNHS